MELPKPSKFDLIRVFNAATTSVETGGRWIYRAFNYFTAYAAKDTAASREAAGASVDFLAGEGGRPVARMRWSKTAKVPVGNPPSFVEPVLMPDMNRDELEQFGLFCIQVAAGLGHLEQMIEDEDEGAADGEVIGYGHDVATALHEPDGYGHAYRHNKTGEHLSECVSCGRLFTIEGMHSGGECNMCHAVNKDD